MDNRIYVGDDGPTTIVETSDDRGSKTAVSEAKQQTTQWWAQKCEEIEELDKQGKQDQMYKAINDLNRKKIRSSISVKDENGKLISDPELVRNRWKEYIEKLYNAEGKPHSLSVEPATDMDDIGPCILEEEVITAIKELKNNKAEEIDETPAELLKCMGNIAVKVSTHLC